MAQLKSDAQLVKEYSHPAQRSIGEVQTPDPMVLVREQARRRTRLRHRIVLISFLACVLLPAVIAVAYLYAIAEDQYSSKVAFSVRSSEQTPTFEILGSLTQSLSGPTVDGEIVYNFIQSQQMVEEVLNNLPLYELYNSPTKDFVFRLGEDRSIEDLVRYWNWMSDISFDPTSGILTFEARAFDPEDARRISQAVLDSSARLVNELSAKARDDAVGFAADELANAEERLLVLRRNIRKFREEEQEIDPSANAQSAIELVAGLETELANTQVRLDTVKTLVSDSAPRARFLEEKVNNLERQIARERSRVGNATSNAGNPDRKALADLLAKFEEFEVRRGFAENAYTTALAVYEQAQAEARRQIRYLATHISPTLSQEPQYPDRELLAAAIFGILLVGWSVLVLVYYNVRDRL